MTHTAGETLAGMAGDAYWQLIQLSKGSTDEQALPGAQEDEQHLRRSSLASSTSQLHSKLVSVLDPKSTLLLFRMTVLPLVQHSSGFCLLLVILWLQ